MMKPDLMTWLHPLGMSYAIQKATKAIPQFGFFIKVVLGFFLFVFVFNKTWNPLQFSMLLFFLCCVPEMVTQSVAHCVP